MNPNPCQTALFFKESDHNINYTYPYGCHTFSLSYQRSKYHQTVASMPYDFISAGDTNISVSEKRYALLPFGPQIWSRVDGGAGGESL
ncbi:ShlB/FhaC/HecB family hemolysin secretion/activation protein [Selenomonas noxia]|uniref:ShlB/FhaC/HecB family hemolysin secretion/activation protein n=1 Tax=Selenomonas noxia TaxID=135083 RepID=UPI0028F3FEC9|nr:ShlB/FhaC/HecB family hemolysin secretion/activation protein [Selenomonas noxia]